VKYLTLGEAAKMTGKSKPTISKAVKDGRLSGQKIDGVYQIEVSELLRVYPAKATSGALTASKPAQPSSAVDELEKMYLERQVADLENRLSEMKDERDQAMTEAKADRARMYALLEDQRPKSIIQRLLGK
jgi:excisionase family DNA binding protein